MLSYGVRRHRAMSIAPWLRAYHRLRISGQENLPREAICVMVPIMQAIWMLVPAGGVPLRSCTQAFPAAAADYFFVSRARGGRRPVGSRACLPSRRHIRRSLRFAGNCSPKPETCSFIFPEGTRSVTGNLAPFRPGVGMLVAGATTPAHSLLSSGTRRRVPKGHGFPDRSGLNENRSRRVFT